MLLHKVLRQIDPAGRLLGQLIGPVVANPPFV
jgi:hypothetical protein